MPRRDLPKALFPDTSGRVKSLFRQSGSLRGRFAQRAFGCSAQSSSSMPKWGLCIALPLDVQGGIQRGLALSVRFGNDAAPHLHSDFRETFAKVPSFRRKSESSGFSVSSPKRTANSKPPCIPPWTSRGRVLQRSHFRRNDDVVQITPTRISFAQTSKNDCCH